MLYYCVILGWKVGIILRSLAYINPYIISNIVYISLSLNIVYFSLSVNIIEKRYCVLSVLIHFIIICHFYPAFSLWLMSYPNLNTNDTTFHLKLFPIAKLPGEVTDRDCIQNKQNVKNDIIRIKNSYYIIRISFTIIIYVKLIQILM